MSSTQRRDPRDREQFDRARKVVLLHRIRASASGSNEYVGQESFATAGEMLALARAAGVGPGVSLLDLCCGLGGPALYLASELGCRIIGVDLSLQAVRAARARALERGLASRVRFLAADVVRLPLAAAFDVAMLFETMLAIEDKGRLLHEVARLLRPGGRLGLTLEEGNPLSPEERRLIPEGNRIWLVTGQEFLGLAHAADFLLRLVSDRTRLHADNARHLLAAIRRHQDAIVTQMGRHQYEDLVVAHARWVEWLTTGRVRKLALVVERSA